MRAVSTDVPRQQAVLIEVLMMARIELTSVATVLGRRTAVPEEECSIPISHVRGIGFARGHNHQIRTAH